MTDITACDLHSANATGLNEMPLGTDTLVVHNIVLDGALVTPQEGETWGSQPQSKFALQIAVTLLHIVE